MQPGYIELMKELNSSYSFTKWDFSSNIVLRNSAIPFLFPQLLFLPLRCSTLSLSFADRVVFGFCCTFHN